MTESNSTVSHENDNSLLELEDYLQTYFEKIIALCQILMDGSYESSSRYLDALPGYAWTMLDLSQQAGEYSDNILARHRMKDRL